MKFLYEFRSSDNVRHEGVICAKDREAAFRDLKAKGIRPGCVREAPGLFNKLFGRGKRWMLIFVLAIVAVVLAVAAHQFRIAARDGNAVFEDKTRRQVIGDLAVIELGMRTGWSDAFEHEGERFLASFAIPGVPAAQRNTTEAEIVEALGRRVGVLATDGLEVRQIKSMVEGMKDELRRFIEKGGTIVEYGQRLVMRQELELSYYRQAESEVRTLEESGADEKTISAAWKEKNDSLRKLGIRLLPIPESVAKWPKKFF